MRFLHTVTCSVISIAIFASNSSYTQNSQSHKAKQARKHAVKSNSKKSPVKTTPPPPAKVSDNQSGIPMTDQTIKDTILNQAYWAYDTFRNDDGTVGRKYLNFTQVDILRKGSVQKGVENISENETRIYEYYPVQIRLWYKNFSSEGKNIIVDFRVYKNQYDQPVMWTASPEVNWKP